MSDELLVTLSMRFPALDRPALAAHLVPLMEAAVAAGGLSTHVSVQPFDPDEDDDE